MAIGLTACTTQEIPPTHNYGVVTSGDFEFMEHGVMTYSWHPESEQVYLSQKYDETVVTDLVRDAIEDQLATKGYQLSQNGAVGDVVIGFGLAEESELNDDSIFDAIKLSTGCHFMMVTERSPRKDRCTLRFSCLTLRSYNGKH